MGEEGTCHTRIPLWLDCDPGHDDAFAILLAAHHPHLELLGISTGYGNTSLINATNNALSVLEAIGRPEIRVVPGASGPFCRTAHAAEDIHGKSGLDGTDLLPVPERKPLSHCNAVTEMRDALLSCPPNTAWLVTTGTLTNAALLFATFPDVAAHIKGLSIMGGAIGNGFADVSMGPPYTDTEGKVHPRIGNTTHFAEFNILSDPESAHSVFMNPVLHSKTALIPLDLTHQAYAGKHVQDLLLYGGSMSVTPSRMRRMFNDLLMFFSHTYAEVFGLKEGPPLHDPLAVAVLLADHDNDHVKIPFDDVGGERWEVSVIHEGEQVGRTVTVAAKDGVTIPRALDLSKFWSSLQDCMARADSMRVSANGD